MSKNDSVALWSPGHRTRTIIKISKVLLIILITVLGFVTSLPIKANASNTTNTNPPNNTSDIQNSQSLQNARAGPVPDLNLPRTVVSSIDNLIGAGGVIQTSEQNLTLYNQAVTLRLVGEPAPHDQLLGLDLKPLSSYLFWGVEASAGNAWVTLAPTLNSFAILGTNGTGTFVMRTMTVSSGQYSGVFKIIYKATSTGPLKWDLEFTASTPGQYRLTYSWRDLPNLYDFSRVKQLHVTYGTVDYTLSWADVPQLFSVSTGIMSNEFSLSISLGSLTAGSVVKIDPSIVSTNANQYATAFPFQRKVFYEATGGYYWVFYWNTYNMVWRNSKDGVSWSAPGSIPLTPGCACIYYMTPVFSSGTTVIVAQGDTATSAGPSPFTTSVSVRYSIGTIAGAAITWGPVQSADTISRTCDNGSPGTTCTITIGVRYVNVAMGAGGSLAFSYNWFTSGPGIGVCSSTSVSSESGIFVIYKTQRLIASCNSGASGYDGQLDRSIVLPANFAGGMRVVYQFPVGSTITLNSRWLDGNGGSAAVETIDPSTLGGDDISAVSDADNGIHVLYRGTDGNVSYAYRTSTDPHCGCPLWTNSKNIFNGSPSSSTITVDQSTNDLYAFAVQGSSIAMKKKPLSQGGLGVFIQNRDWPDGSTIYPITGRASPANLGSDLVSSSAKTSNSLLLIWTEGTGPYTAMFASVPIQTAWSPYSSPSDPWDGNGYAPNGQYISNLAEQVSPSTGMLTVRQTDFLIPGRGISLEIGRAYTEPNSFLNGKPNGYEAYPWAPLGNGWQLGFPWMNNVTAPSFIHLWNGEAYRIPASFWQGGTGSTSFENHQGEHFALAWTFTANTVVLYTKSGVSYIFDQSHRLTTITDTTNNNTITFTYDASNHISKIADTVQRSILFCYSGNLLHSINETTGTCASGVGSSRGVIFTYSGATLSSVTDSVGRVNSYQYNAVSDPNVSQWLLGRITYPTLVYTNLTYTSVLLGSGASSFRVLSQQVLTSAGSVMQQFGYSYAQSAGDQVVGSTVKFYNSTQLVGFNDYAFSFAGVNWNVSDSGHRLVRGFQQLFGVHGEVIREVFVVTNSSGAIGSFINTYRYDLWGNLIYSRKAINPSANWYHESFNANYNTYQPPALDSYEEGHFFGNFIAVTPTSGAGQSFRFSGSATNIGSAYWYLYYWPPAGGALDSGLIWTDLYMGSNQTDPTKSLPTGSSLARSQCCVYIRDIPSNPSLVRFTFAPNAYTLQPNTVYEIVLSGQFSSTATQYVEVGGGLTPAHQGLGSYRSGTTWYPFGMGINNIFYVYGSNQPLNSFNAFQESFEQNQGRASNNLWSVQNGYWVVKEGSYNGSETSGPQESTFAWSDIGKSDVSIQAQVYIARQINASQQRVGILAHYPGTGSTKWALVLHNRGSAGTYLELLDEYTAWLGDTQPSAKTSCAITTGVWYTFNMTIHGFQATGWANTQSQTCSVSGTFSNTSPAAAGTGFGLYAGGYSALFDDVVVSTVSPNITTTGFSNSFPQNGSPGPKVHSAVAGVSELQNATGTRPIESYYSYYSWGGTSQQTMRYDSPTGVQWITSSRTFDFYGNQKTLTDARGTTTYNTYSPAYQSAYLTNTTRILSPGVNVTTSYTYDFSSGRQLTVVDPLTNKTDYQYDAIGRLTVVRHPAVNGVRSEIDMFFEDTKNSFGIENEKNNYTDFNVDGFGRITAINRHSGDLTTPVLSNEKRTFNWQGRVVTQTLPDGNVTTSAYDVLGRLIKVTNPDGTFRTISYDDLNMVQSTYDENGHRTDKLFDAQQRMIGIREFYSSSAYYATSYKYDEVRNQVKIVDSKGQTTILSYDNLNRLRLTVFPDGFNETRSYDNVGNLVSKKDPNGNTITYGYDNLNRLTTITYPNLQQASFSYDKNGNRVGMSDSSSTSKFTYDSRNRLTSETWTIFLGGLLSITLTASYSYDSVGNLVGITYPDNTVVTYSIDQLNRISSIQTGKITLAIFTYAPNTKASSISYGNGVQTAYKYNPRQDPTEVKVTQGPKTLLDLNYGYDSAENLVSINAGSSSAESYSYDALNRLVSSSGPWGTQKYGYDSVGNRLWFYTNSGTSTTNTTYAYGPYNRMTSVCCGYAGANSYTYDNNGNLKTITVPQLSGNVTYTYNYDYENRLTSIGSSGTYAYSPLGQRILKSESDFTAYVSNGVNEIYEHHLAFNMQVTAQNDFVYANGMMVAELSGKSTLFFHQDMLGSVRLVTTGSKTSFSTNYEPFGPQFGATGTDPTYKYTGKPQDTVSTVTSLYYFGARYYDPTTGRFITRDPAHPRQCVPQTLNPYVYVINNPETLTDPTGACIGRWDLAVDLLSLALHAAGLWVDWSEFLGKALDTYYLIGSALYYLANGDFWGFVQAVLPNIVWAILIPIVQQLPWWIIGYVWAEVVSGAFWWSLLAAIVNFLWSVAWQVFWPPVGVCW